MKRATCTLPRVPLPERVSIHALNEESDQKLRRMADRFYEFQSTLSMKRATIYQPVLTILALFQSTLSMKRATGLPDGGFVFCGFQSTLSMKRATGFRGYRVDNGVVSIHALNEESDRFSRYLPDPWKVFQSTLSMKRATDHTDDKFILRQFQSTLSMKRATRLAR